MSQSVLRHLLLPLRTWTCPWTYTYQMTWRNSSVSCMTSMNKRPALHHQRRGNTKQCYASCCYEMRQVWRVDGQKEVKDKETDSIYLTRSLTLSSLRNLKKCSKELAQHRAGSSAQPHPVTKKENKKQDQQNKIALDLFIFHSDA